MRSTGEQKSKEYTMVNPMQKVPALKDGDLVSHGKVRSQIEEGVIEQLITQLYTS